MKEALLLCAAAAASAVASYWYFVFRRLLPLERRLNRLAKGGPSLDGRPSPAWREAKVLHSVASLSADAPQSESVLSAVVSLIAKHFDADMVAFLFLDEEKGELAVQPGAYGLEGAELHYRLPLSRDDSSSVRVFKSGEPFFSEDAQNDPGAISDYAKLWKMHSLMVIPIRLSGRTIGVMRVGSVNPGRFSQEDLEALTAVAEETAVIVEAASLNRKLSEAMERLRALNRMKDEFISTVSHEFKTPLTTILGFAAVVLDEEAGPLTEQQRKFLTVTKNAAKRLETLVSTLLDMSKIESEGFLVKEPMSLAQTVKSSVERHRPAADNSGKTIYCQIQERVADVLGDAKWLGLVLDNLLSNALKFSRQGGRVDVAVKDKGDFVLVSVEDQGVGIVPEDKDRVFERFFRSAKTGPQGVPGTGLGLSIAKDVVLKHGGNIWFESEEGRGTKFYFVIPAARGAVEAR